MSADVPTHSSSVDSDDTDSKLKNLSVDDGSDSDSDCYVGPLELNCAVKMSCAEGYKPDKHFEHTDEYDYPYMEGITHVVTNKKSTPSEVGYQNVPVKAVRHNRVHIPMSASFDTNTSPDYKTDTKKHELSSGLWPAQDHIVRASSQVEILEPLVEGEDYIKMHPEKMNAMVKSHSCDDGRMLQISDQNGTPGTSPVNSQREHNNYKSINRQTIATDGMFVCMYVCMYVHSLLLLYNIKLPLMA